MKKIRDMGITVSTIVTGADNNESIKFMATMAYVGGGFDATLVGLVRRAGYTTARSIIRGIRQPEADRYTLRVVALAPGDDVIDADLGEITPGVPTFAAKVTGAHT